METNLGKAVTLKRRIASILAAVILALAAVGFAAQPASADILIFHTSDASQRGIWVSSGYNGHGDDDFVPPGGVSELYMVGSMRLPARCAGYFNGVKLWAKHAHSRYINFYWYSPYGNFKVRC